MRTHCFRCQNPLESGRDHSWCIPCLKAYKKTFNKGRKVMPERKYVLNELGLKVRLIPELVTSDYNRFWSKAILTANPDKCWNWDATIRVSTNKPYGRFCIHKHFYQAHRVAYFLQNKKDPAELSVLHKCDNHRCVNPNHLFLGTNNENIQDKIRKGRGSGYKSKPKSYESTLRGSKHSMAKLNESLVSEIRIKYSNGGTSFNTLAKEYSVSKKTILQVIHNRIWRHI